MSIVFAIRRTGPTGRAMLAKADSLRRPVDREDLTDEIVARNGAPHAAVAGLRAVVAHHEVVTLGDLPRPVVLLVALAGLQVRLRESLPVDVDRAVPLRDDLPRKANQALYERPTGSTTLPCGRWRLKNDNVAALRVPQVVDEAVREHAVREPRHLPLAGAGAGRDCR